mgnify:CR=1 FL=1
MENDELLNAKAKIEFDKMTAHQKDLVEFNRLGGQGSGFKDLLLATAPFAMLLITNSVFEIEPELFQLLCILIFASSFVQSMVTAQSKKNNRRIDLLYKIIKQENNKNSQ